MSRQQTVALVFDLLRARATSASAPGSPGHGIETPDGLEAQDCLDAQDWPEVIAMASAHFVLAALAPALDVAPSGNRAPSDVAEFLSQITRANQARNRSLLTALVAVSRRLAELGVVPVVLKGAAFLAEDQAGAADWRFMQDIDLLVPADQLDACVAALAELGYPAEDAIYDPATEAHYPPLQSPCGRFSIELHTRLFGRGDFGLGAAAVVRDVRPVSIDGVAMLVPSPRHRLGHILVHAQIHNRFHAAERLVLKDLLDLSMLARQHAPVLQAGVVDGLFAGNPRVQQATRALFDTWSAWQAGPNRGSADPGPWGRRALARLGWSGWQQAAHMPADLARLELHRLRSEPGHLTRRLQTIASPSRLAGTALAWSAKQRQRLWG